MNTKKCSCKVSIFVSAFLVLAACQPASNSLSTSSKQNLETSGDMTDDQVRTQSFPLLTLKTLLSANDVVVGLKSAASNNDLELLEYWQTQLLIVAKEARLSESETAQISGPQGLAFLKFKGLSLNYDDEFMRLLLAFEALDPLFAKYPQLSSLHDYSRVIENQRDEAIAKAAEALASEYEPEMAIKVAKRAWQNSMLATR